MSFLGIFSLNPPILPMSAKMCMSAVIAEISEFSPNSAKFEISCKLKMFNFSPKSPITFQLLGKCDPLGPPQKKVTWLIQMTSKAADDDDADFLVALRAFTRPIKSEPGRPRGKGGS